MRPQHKFLSFSPPHAPLSEAKTHYFILLLFPTLLCTIFSTWIAFSNSGYQNAGHPARPSLHANPSLKIFLGKDLSYEHQ